MRATDRDATTNHTSEQVLSNWSTLFCFYLKWPEILHINDKFDYTTSCYETVSIDVKRELVLCDMLYKLDWSYSKWITDEYATEVRNPGIQPGIMTSNVLTLQEEEINLH